MRSGEDTGTRGRSRGRDNKRMGMENGTQDKDKEMCQRGPLSLQASLLKAHLLAFFPSLSSGSRQKEGTSKSKLDFASMLTRPKQQNHARGDTGRMGQKGKMKKDNKRKIEFKFI